VPQQYDFLQLTAETLITERQGSFFRRDKPPSLLKGVFQIGRHTTSKSKLLLVHHRPHQCIAIKERSFVVMKLTFTDNGIHIFISKVISPVHSNCFTKKMPYTTCRVKMVNCPTGPFWVNNEFTKARL